MTTKGLFQLPIGPGLYTEQSQRGAVGQWYRADKVRFRKGLAEKIGGWVRLEPPFLGTCRRLKDWSSLDAKRWAAVATDTKLYLWQDETLFDITPVRRSVTLTAPFQTFTGETRVHVTDVNHGAQAGDYVRFSNTIVGGASGITVVGEYRILAIINSNTYLIADDETATVGGAGEGGTAVAAEYDISTGASSVTTATGYGTGPYGREGYGNARTGSTLQIGIQTWSLDTWGEDLLACPRGGAIYWWDRSLGTGSRAVALGGDAPPNNEYMVVSQRDRHVLALGAFDFFTESFDPLLIRWSSTEDLNDWVPTSTNTSGELRLYSGSKIVAGVRSRLETVIFTDVSVHTLPFVGGFTVFGLNIVGENVSIMGPNCAVPVDHRVIFMAEADFYLYDGIVKVIPCDVRNFVYDNLNTVQRDKIYGGLNREFNEVWWFYPSYDPEAWVQESFDLGLPTGYEIANASSAVGDPCWDDVVLLAKFDGADGATAYTEIKRSEPGTFVATAQLDDAQTAAGTASLLLDGNSDVVVFGDNAPSYAAYQLASTDDAVVEAFIRFATLPAVSERRTIVTSSMQDFNNFDLEVYNNAGTYQLRANFGFGSTNVGTITPSINVWYHVAAQRRYAPGDTRVDLLFDGVRVSETVNNAVPSTDTEEPILIGAYDNLSIGTYSRFFNGHIDSVRVTKCARYPDAGTYTIPSAEYPESAGGTQDIGYTYVFNSGGYTEVLATADTNYEHDYLLINDQPVLTPLIAEYAVELDVNPAIGAGTGKAGMCFLRSDLVGTAGTDADDAQQFMLELSYATNTIELYKKESTGISAPDNLGTPTMNFTTLTGSAMALGQKYILTVSVNSPTITAYVDGFQAFQFTLSAQELLDFTGGTIGMHMRAAFPNDDQYRFYNLASGPVGVITAPNFDISPIEVNRYVVLNYEEGTWTTGTLSRTAWSDRSPLLEKAYAAGADGYLYKHETGTDDNGAAMEAFIESFDMEIPQSGEELMHIDQLIPDFLTLEGSVDVYLTGLKYPQDSNRITKGPYTVSNGTRKLSTRIRARQVALRIESNSTGDKWRMGNWRGRAGPHGKRG